jgi:adenosine deaminase
VGLNLHTHLEGWVRPATAADLAVQMGIPAPAAGWEEALVMREPADLTVYLAHVAAAYPVLGAYDALRRVAREAVEDAAADGCDYLEIRFGPATHVRPGFSLDAVVAAACEGLAEGSATTGLDAGLVVCLLRHLADEVNLDVARTAAQAAGRGVVGLDVAGDEILYPSVAAYRDAYAIAAAAGLGLTAHAAEAGSADAVREAVELLGVRRIGHGSRAADDQGVLDWARDHGITFEVCPSSNVLTGAAPSLAEHPFHAFLDAGCAVVLGDDDPVTTGRTMGDEERLLIAEGGLDPEALQRIHAHAVRVAFTDDATRARLSERVSRPPGPSAEA